LIRVVVGGTFDFLHKGHRVLLDKAIETGDIIEVGITSDEMAEKHRGYPVRSFEERKRLVEEYLSSRGAEYHIVMIHDPCGKNKEFGSAAEEDYHIIVVSPETRGMADKINSARRRNGLEPMEIVTIPCILADDRKPISSKRIRRGEIDEEGKVVKD
jgi:cytidyltransferase-like protein